MARAVETLDKLERRITLSFPAERRSVRKSRSASRSWPRTVRPTGFRPGKVPMKSVAAQRYGYSVHYDVLNDKVGQAFSQAANEAKLRVAGMPRSREGRRAGRHAGLRRHLRGLPGSQASATWPAPRSSASRPTCRRRRSTRPSTSCASSARTSTPRRAGEHGDGGEPAATATA